MKTLMALIERNRKLFFKDAGMLFSSLITPVILIVLYVTFLAKVYKDSFVANMPSFMQVTDGLIDGVVAGQLTAALLAVSCVTVTFCVNLAMVQDKATGNYRDFDVSPIRRSTKYMGYFFATVLNSLMINFLAMGLCLLYVWKMGWFLSVADVVWLVLDVIILVLFGAMLSSIVCYPLKTQGQMSAVGTIVSVGYGFICGAYMPISNFGEGLQKAMSYLPSTYGTSMLKNHMLRGAFEQLESEGFPAEVVKGIADSLDCNPAFRGSDVSVNAMILIMLLTVAVLAVIYLGITAIPEKK